MSEFLLQIGRLGGLREQFCLVRYLAGRAFCNLARFLDSGFRPVSPVYSGFEPATSRSAVRYATNSANHSQNPAPLTKYPGFWSQSGFHYAKSSGNLGLNINGTLCEGGNVLEKSRSSLTSRPGPTETCHSFFKHSRVQSYMTDREVIKVSVKTFSNGTPRLGWNFVSIQQCVSIFSWFTSSDLWHVCLV